MIQNHKIKFGKKTDKRIKNLILKILKINPWFRPSCREILLDSGFNEMLKEHKIIQIKQTKHHKNK